MPASLITLAYRAVSLLMNSENRQAGTNAWEVMGINTHDYTSSGNCKK